MLRPNWSYPTENQQCLDFGEKFDIYVTPKLDYWKRKQFPVNNNTIYVLSLQQKLESQFCYDDLPNCNNAKKSKSCSSFIKCPLNRFFQIKY